MGYLSLTDADRAEMLAAIGVSSVDELFEQIPPGVRFDRELDVPPALGEAELVRHLEELAAKNVHTGRRALVPRRRDLRPLRPVGRRRRALARRVPDRVHAVPARDEPGHAAGDLRVPDGHLRAHGDGRLERVRLRRLHGRRRRLLRRASTSSDRRKVVLAETLNPQVRQVVKTYAPGFGLEVVEVPQHGTARPIRTSSRAAAADAAAVLFQQPNFLGCLEARARARRRRERRGGAVRSRTSTSCRSACSRRPASTAARSRSGRARPPGTGPRTAGRTTASLRRGATTSGACPGASSGRRSTPTAAEHSCSRCRRASSTSAARRRRRTSRRTRRCSRSPGSRRSRGSGRRGCARSARRASRSRSTRASACRSSPRSRRARFKEVAFRTPIPAREVVRRAREHGVNPGYALGRDYEGMDDVLLVAVTEKKSVADVDRLAEVLAEVCA